MSRKKKIAVLAGGLAVLLALGVAFATWTATGSGSGQAKAVTKQTVTVTAGTATADLYPGFTDGDLYFTLTNPNPYGIDFTSFDATTVTSSDQTNCPAANVTVDDSGAISVHTDAGDNPSPQKSIPDVVTMAGTAPDGCSGVTFTVALTLSGSQS